MKKVIKLTESDLTKIVERVIKESEELDYLDTHWKDTRKRLDDIANKIKTQLPIINDVKQPEGNEKLKTIKYSDLDGPWNTYGKSPGLEVLADKIVHMINMGRSDSIKRMVEKIATGRIKSLSKPSNYGDAEFLGKGHFRWNDQAYRLSQREIERLKEFFNL